MHRTIRHRIIFVTLLALLVLPLAAGARGVETPRPTAAVTDGWLATAWDWFQDVFARRPHRGGGQTASSPTSVQKGEAGGSCIDPQGRPRPWIECL
jgi:hypothetical protein